MEFHPNIKHPCLFYRIFKDLSTPNHRNKANQIKCFRFFPKSLNFFSCPTHKKHNKNKKIIQALEQKIRFAKNHIFAKKPKAPPPPNQLTSLNFPASRFQEPPERLFIIPHFLPIRDDVTRFVLNDCQVNEQQAHLAPIVSCF